MTRFDDCLHHVLGFEGGYSAHPDDRGGSTNSGITQDVYDCWRLSKGYGRQPVIGISSDEITAIYRDLYWRPAKCDQLPRPVDLVVFDAAVNHGVRQSAKFLQRALGVEDDGAVGPVTIAAASASVPALVAEDIIRQRRDFYRKLADRTPSQQVFLRGWLNRMDFLAEVAYG